MGVHDIMRGTFHVILPVFVAAVVGCGTGVKGESTSAGEAAPPKFVSTTAAIERPIQRFLEVTGTLGDMVFA